MAERKKLDWSPLDIEHLGSAQPAWAAFAKEKETVKPLQDKIAAQLTPVREKLEEAITRQMVADGLVTNTQSVRFAYNFGRVAYAVVDSPIGRTKGAIQLGNTVGKGKGR